MAAISASWSMATSLAIAFAQYVKAVGLHNTVAALQLGLVSEAHNFNIFLQLAPDGSVSSYLRTHGPMGVPKVRHYSSQPTAGLAYLHSWGVLHRDLKCANLLLDLAHRSLKLCDFGVEATLAGAVTQLAEVKSVAGAPAYLAPEVIKGEQIGRKADVWALGCCVVEMASARAPWSELEMTNSFSLMFGSALQQWTRPHIRNYQSRWLVMRWPLIGSGNVFIVSPSNGWLPVNCSTIRFARAPMRKLKLIYSVCFSQPYVCKLFRSISMTRPYQDLRRMIKKCNQQYKDEALDDTV